MNTFRSYSLVEHEGRSRLRHWSSLLSIGPLTRENKCEILNIFGHILIDKTDIRAFGLILTSNVIG